MENEIIKEVLLRQQEEKAAILRGNFVKRDVDMSKQLNNTLIKVIIGPRRAGKSYFCLQSLKDSTFAYANFDDEKLSKIDDYDDVIKYLKEIYGDFKTVLFDEIQNLPEWQLFVNRLQRTGYNIILTGSNSNLLSSELATHLTGRHIQVDILPFSFREFVRARDLENKLDKPYLKDVQGQILNALGEFIHIGGFPDVIIKNMEFKSYLSTLVDSITLNDIVKRHNIRFSDSVSTLIRYLISASAKEVSLNSMKKVSGVGSVHTAAKYLDYLKEAFLVFSLDRFSTKVKEQLRSPKKIYFIDNGIINALSFNLRTEEGKLIENAVAIELLRESNLFSSFRVFYWKNQNSEVDFVVKEGLKVKQLLQVSYNVERESTKQREIKALISASKELRCDNLLVITWDYEAEEKIEGKLVRFIPLWKWLLSDWSLSEANEQKK